MHVYYSIPLCTYHVLCYCFQAFFTTSCVSYTYIRQACSTFFAVTQILRIWIYIYMFWDHFLLHCFCCFLMNLFNTVWTYIEVFNVFLDLSRAIVTLLFKFLNSSCTFYILSIFLILEIKFSDSQPFVKSKSHFLCL